MFKKICIVGAIGCVISMASCQSNSSTKNSVETGAELDSMVNQATSAVKSSTDTLKQSINSAMDSTKSKMDSSLKGH